MEILNVVPQVLGAFLLLFAIILGLWAFLVYFVATFGKTGNKEDMSPMQMTTGYLHCVALAALSALCLLFSWSI